MKLLEIVPAHSWEHRMEIRRMAGDVIPKDRSWQVVLMVSAIAILNMVLFVRWWTI